jgi:hypothetical protein
MKVWVGRAPLLLVRVAAAGSSESPVSAATPASGMTVPPSSVLPPSPGRAVHTWFTQSWPTGQATVAEHGWLVTTVLVHWHALSAPQRRRKRSRFIGAAYTRAGEEE